VKPGTKLGLHVGTLNRRILYAKPSIVENANKCRPSLHFKIGLRTVLRRPYSQEFRVISLTTSGVTRGVGARGQGQFFYFFLTTYKFAFFLSC